MAQTDRISKAFIAATTRSSNVAIANLFTLDARLVLHSVSGSCHFEKRTISLKPNIECEIGRRIPGLCEPSRSNAIFDCKVLSRNHASVWYEHDGKFWLQDRSSSNGTYLNGNKLGKAEAELHCGDIIQLGTNVQTSCGKGLFKCIIARVSLVKLSKTSLGKSLPVTWNKIQINTFMDFIEMEIKKLEEEIFQSPLKNELLKLIDEQFLCLQTETEALNNANNERCEVLQQLEKMKLELAASTYECKNLRNQLATMKSRYDIMRERLHLQRMVYEENFIEKSKHHFCFEQESQERIEKLNQKIEERERDYENLCSTIVDMMQEKSDMLTTIAPTDDDAESADCCVIQSRAESASEQKQRELMEVVLINAYQPKPEVDSAILENYDDFTTKIEANVENIDNQLKNDSKLEASSSVIQEFDLIASPSSKQENELELAVSVTDCNIVETGVLSTQVEAQSSNRTISKHEHKLEVPVEVGNTIETCDQATQVEVQPMRQVNAQHRTATETCNQSTQVRGQSSRLSLLRNEYEKNLEVLVEDCHTTEACSQSTQVEVQSSRLSLLRYEYKKELEVPVEDCHTTETCSQSTQVGQSSRLSLLRREYEKKLEVLLEDCHTKELCNQSTQAEAINIEELTDVYSVAEAITFNLDSKMFDLHDEDDASDLRPLLLKAERISKPFSATTNNNKHDDGKNFLDCNDERNIESINKESSLKVLHPTALQSSSLLRMDIELFNEVYGKIFENHIKAKVNSVKNLSQPVNLETKIAVKQIVSKYITLPEYIRITALQTSALDKQPRIEAYALNTLKGMETSSENVVEIVFIAAQQQRQPQQQHQAQLCDDAKCNMKKLLTWHRKAFMVQEYFPNFTLLTCILALVIFVVVYGLIAHLSIKFIE